MNEFMNLDHVATPARAWAMILPAFFFFAILDTSGKYLVVAGLAPLFVVWCRFAIHSLFIIVILRSWRSPDFFKTRHPWLQLVRGLLLAATTLSNFLALRHLQLAETLAIFLATPMVVTAFAGPLLGEWAGWRRWMAVSIGFIGVLIIVRPGTTMFQWPIVYALSALTLNSLYLIMTRKLTGTESDESMIIMSGLIPAILLSPVVFIYGFDELPQTGFQITAFLLLGICGSIGHLFLIKAHRLAPAPLIAPAVYTAIIWGTGLGYLVFNQLPDLWTVAGIMIITAGGLYILHREHVLKTQTTIV